MRNAQLDSSGVYSINAQYTSSANYYIRKKGTSMAAPVVAGIAAVVRAINPSLTAFETKQILIDTATASAAANGKTISGAYANASVAFSTAENAISAGLKPAASGDPYTVYENQTQSTSSAGSQERGGGCGTITGPSSGSGDGPFGGNSLILFSLFYFAWVVLRKIQKRHSH
jgi:subtilisin family serine protease